MSIRGLSLSLGVQFAPDRLRQTVNNLQNIRVAPTRRDNRNHKWLPIRFASTPKIIPVDTLSIPIVMRRINTSTVPIGNTPEEEYVLTTMVPVMIPSTIKILPSRPKNSMGFLSEISTIIRLRLPKPCLSGFSVEPSFVYIADIGTSTIYRKSALLTLHHGYRLLR